VSAEPAQTPRRDARKDVDEILEVLADLALTNRPVDRGSFGGAREAAVANTDN
jgi:hypothetical protein